MKISVIVISCFIFLGCKNDDPPPPVSGITRVSGIVVNAVGAPVEGASLYAVYGYRVAELNEPDTPTGFVMRSYGSTTFDLVVDSRVEIVLTDRLRENFRVTLVNGVLAAGRHVIEVNLEEEPNGIYDLSFQMSPNGPYPVFTEQRIILKNESALEILADTSPLAISATDGHYSFYVNSGQSVITEPTNGGLIVDRVHLYVLNDLIPPIHTLLSTTPGSSLAWNPVVEATIDENAYIQDGDTLYLLSESTQMFADTNLVLDAYLLREYQIAINPNYNSTPYNSTLDDWKTETWEERRQYLPPPYSGDILVYHLDLRYWMITSQMIQFGYGWRDTFDANADLDHDWEQDIWSEVSGDDPLTIGFDGTSNLRDRFRSMWIPVE